MFISHITDKIVRDLTKEVDIMKKKYVFSLSRVVQLLLIVTLVIAFTGYKNKLEKTGIGNVSIAGGVKYVYSQDVDISFCVPEKFQGYFADTGNTTVAKLLKDRQIRYITFDSQGEYEITVRQFDSKAQSFDEDEFKDIYYTVNEIQEINEYNPQGYVKADGMELYHIYLSRYDNAWKEYNIVSAYAGINKGKYFVVEVYKLFDKEHTLAQKQNEVESMSGQILESIKSGNATAKSTLPSIFSRSFALWVFMLILVYVVFTNTSYSSTYGLWTDPLERTHTRHIMGILSVVIVLHHLTQHIGQWNAGIMGILEYVGVCCVGVFFFYSGYGLLLSYHNKPGYLDNFFKKRIPTVLLPFVVCNLIFFVWALIRGKFESTGDILLGLFGIDLINDHMWYMIEILFLYVIFWLVFRFIKNENKALIVMALVIAAMVAGSLLLGHGVWWFQGEWWYNTTMLFVLGMAYEKFGNKLDNFAKKHYRKCLVVIIVAFIILFALSKYTLDNIGYWTETATGATGNQSLDKLLTLIPQLAMVIVFMALLLIIGLKVKVGNCITAFLGEISLELYLMHNLFIEEFSFIPGSGIFFVCVLIASLVAALLVHNVICLIFKKPLINILNIRKYFKFKIPKISKLERKRRLKLLPRTIICTILAISILIPLYLLAVNGTQRGIITNKLSLPGSYFLENLNGMNAEYVSYGGGIYRGILNSCLVAFPAALLATYFSALTAYSFERYDFKGKKILWKCVIALLFVPSSVGFLSYYGLLAKTGLLNKFAPVIMLYVANPAAVYFVRMYLMNFKLNEITEAARIDGAGEFRIFNKIILPTLTPVLALQLTFSFVASWNDGYRQTLLLMDWSKKTAPSYIETGYGAGAYPELYAVAFAVSLIPIIIYIFCAKYIVNSITLGAVKE